MASHTIAGSFAALLAPGIQGISHKPFEFCKRATILTTPSCWNEDRGREKLKPLSSFPPLLRVSYSMNEKEMFFDAYVFDMSVLVHIISNSARLGSNF